MEGRSPGQDTGTVQGMDDFVRALRFPEPTFRDLAWFLSGVLILALVIWISWRMTRKSRPAPLLEPPSSLPASDVDAHHRRDSARAPMHLEAEVFLQGFPLPFHGWICDLSAGGTSLILERIPLPQDRLRIRFPDAEGTVDLDAEVLRSEAAHWSHRHYLHCRFLDPTEEQAHRIQRIVDVRKRALRRPS